MAVKMLESSVEASLVRFALRHGIYTRKFTSPSQRGVPDRIFVHNGSVLFMEIKRPGQSPTKLQSFELQLLQAAGASATWVNTVEDGKATLEAVFRLTPNPFHAASCSCGCNLL